MRKNTSIRTKILVGVVLVNMLGIIVTMVYLHQAYGTGVDESATHTVAMSAAAWEQIQGGKRVDPVADPAGIAGVLSGMQKITGANYVFLLDKQTADEKAYGAAREAANLPNNWSEGDTYATVAATDENAAARVTFNVPSGDVPEIGKGVGVENGACAETCHNGITGEGDYWGVAWSDDSRSRSHGVFPVLNESNQPIGVIYAIEDVSRQANAARGSMLRTFVVIAATLLISTLFIGGMIDTLVFKRLRRMMGAMEDVSIRVVGGDFDAHFEPDGTGDEIGHFEAFFARTMDVMTSALKALSQGRAA